MRLSREQTGVGVPGKFYMLDHVHPSIPGHMLIADALTEELIRRDIVDPVPDWRQGRDQRTRDYLDSLGRLYFERGQEQLEALMLWTQGEATRVRPESAAPQANR